LHEDFGCTPTTIENCLRCVNLTSDTS
jgi:urease alpha subunit